MKWLTNIESPAMPGAENRAARGYGETPQDAWRRQREWLKGKIIGSPQSTEKCTVEQLVIWGMVGVYEEDET